MNILVDIRSLLDRPYTGVAQYTMNFLKQTLSQDSENQYFLFYNSAKLKNIDLPKLDFPNLKIIDFHWPNKIFNFLLWLFQWPKIDRLVEKRIGQKIDEIFCPNFNFFAFSRRKKITLVVHDLSFEIYPHFFTFRQRLWHKLIKPKKICQRAEKIITHSENTKNDLIKFYQIPPDKIKVEKPPINPEFKKIEKNDRQLFKVKKKYQLPTDFILYLGCLEPRKNLETLIYALASLLDSRLPVLDFGLIVAGCGREKKKLEKLTKDLKIEERVKFLGYLPEVDKYLLYHLAKVFVYPSFYEGYGYPVVEALACGTPVITSHSSSLTEIENEKIIFVNPYDLNDLIKAIKTSVKLKP
ncbi:MAG: glycosyltransferase family 4 protein [Patescibacteria group bacterium]|nr:glycosyltransferase family 4 protein [Patescibacteria group bacterium]